MSDKRGDHQRRVRQERHAAKEKEPPIQQATGDTSHNKRPRHTDGDWEKLLRDAEERGWSVTKGQNYYRCKCGCAEKRWVQVQLTASSSRSLINKRKQFERSQCWDADPETEDGGR
jgi:hypothetical protein